MNLLASSKVKNSILIRLKKVRLKLSIQLSVISAQYPYTIKKSPIKTDLTLLIFQVKHSTLIRLKKVRLKLAPYIECDRKFGYPNTIKEVRLKQNHSSD